MASNPRDVVPKVKQVSPVRLLGFLDKVKAYPSLKVSAPEIFRNMQVAEPNTESSVNGLKITLRRVIRDESLDSVGFDVELANPSDKDFLYDPESFGIRVGDEVYPQAVCDAEGRVEAGKTLPAFFVVAGTATGDRNDLAVTNKFDIVMRKVIGEKDSRVFTQWKEPPDTFPTSELASRAPSPTADANGVPTSSRARVAEDRKLRRPHRRSGKSAPSIAEKDPVRANKEERSGDMALQAEEE